MVSPSSRCYAPYTQISNVMFAKYYRAADGRAVHVKCETQSLRAHKEICAYATVTTSEGG